MHDTKQNLLNQVFDRANLQSIVNQKNTSPKLTSKPFITIARDPGSGGHPIGKLTAQKLGYNFYDDELVQQIAKSVKKRKKVIEKVDERTRNAIQDIVHSLFNPEYISDTAYIKHLTKTVLSLTSQGSCVILGRGSNFIAPRSDGLHVLITAPKQVRIKRAILYEKISHKVAKNRVEKITKERKDFVSQYFNKSYSNPKYYDLIINTDYYDINAASDLVIAAFRKKFPTITEAIKTTLKKTSKLY